jgi:hypothetical protein
LFEQPRATDAADVHARTARRRGTFRRPLACAIFDGVDSTMLEGAIAVASGVRRQPMEPYRSMKPQHFYAATNRHVLCLDRASGKEIWRAQAVSGATVTLLVAEGRIYAASTGSAACVDESSGKVIWTTAVDGLASPVAIALDFVVPGGQLFLACPGLLFSLSATTGKLLWTNGLVGLGYHPVCLRVPGAITSQPVVRVVRSGNSSRTEILEDEQGGT